MAYSQDGHDSGSEGVSPERPQESPSCPNGGGTGWGRGGRGPVTEMWAEANFPFTFP